MRLPEDQASGIAAYLADRKGELVADIDSDDTSDFAVTAITARIGVLSEVARLVGSPPAKGRKPKAPLKPGPGQDPEAYLAHLRRVLTPEGWDGEDGIRAKLESQAETALGLILLGQDVPHQRALRAECLKLARYLSNVDLQGQAAEARLRARAMRSGANAGR